MITKIIKFGAPWCQGCISADIALDQLSAIKPDIEITKVNIEENDETSAKYKVRGLPPLVYLNSSDKDIARHTGKISIQEILNTINDDGL